jgi:cytochrome c oxidase subunit 2
VSGREITVEMTGADYRWRTRHAGFDGSLDTPDDIIGGGNLVVPAGRTVHLLLRSDDFVYTFYVPDLNVNQIAVPSLTFDARFVCDSPGEIAYIADQMCGFLHETLLGDVTVISESDYADWLRNGKASRAQANTGSKSAGRVGT